MGAISTKWLAAEAALIALQDAVDADIDALISAYETSGGAENAAKAATASEARAVADGSLAALRTNGGRTGRKLTAANL